MPTIEETIAFIQNVHAGQTDKAGEPYWKHPYAVMKRLPEDTDVEVKLAALLHDVLEDTPKTREDLLEMGYSERTVRAVEAVTKKKGDPHSYEEWIDLIIASGNADAILVKYADMSENFDPERIAKLPPDLQSKLSKKYSGPLKKLKAAVDALAAKRPAPAQQGLPHQHDPK